MKFSVSFLPGEEDAAASVLMAVLHLFPHARIRKNNKHPPFSHIYVTTKIPDKSGGDDISTCHFSSDTV